MPARSRVRAVVTLRRRKDEVEARGEIPLAVRRALGAREEDSLVFEEGCQAAVQEAALKGDYFVLRLERSHVPAPAPAPEPPQESRPPSQLEPLAAAVERKLRGEE